MSSDSTDTNKTDEPSWKSGGSDLFIKLPPDSDSSWKPASQQANSKSFWARQQKSKAEAGGSGGANTGSKK
ncbi:hypothetical protein D9757_011206 [Collybiopsis confluens]|uniref:Uncharacterized protein n=1 Tax=Collybiopsis confluens TaxID=2823264 RepID=A0A8H5H2Z4_9AGAR|nr:hypothetical protein D9757_011206 [Collybiopsis confluens]